MAEVMFFIRTLVITSLCVGVLQIRVGGRRLEDKYMDWLRSSALSRWSEQAAESTNYLLKDVTTSVESVIGSKKMKENITSKTEAVVKGRVDFTPERSRIYNEINSLKEKAADATSDVAEAPLEEDPFN